MFQTSDRRQLSFYNHGCDGGVAVSTTRSRYTVGNIVAVIVCMFVSIFFAWWGFTGGLSRGTPVFNLILFSGFAVALGWAAIKAIRSRRR
jgi:hypothetical protein